MAEQLKIRTIASLRNEIDFDSQASVGARTAQEDYALFSTNPSGSELLAVLADGMGGHSAGEVASKRAVDAFHLTYNNYPPSSVPAKLSAALNQANNDLAICIKESPALSGMGCTLVGVHIGHQGLHWISVGDSPLFLFRNGKIKRLNADHSMVPVIEESLRQGKITKKEALAHPDRHALRSAVSGGQIELIDSSQEPVALRGGDIVILASDGLLTISESEISSVIKSQSTNNAHSIVGALMKAVVGKNKPKQDNTTIQVFVARENMGIPKPGARLGWWLLALVALATLGALAYTFRGDFIDLPKVPNLLQNSKVIVTPTPVQAPDSPTEAASSPASSPAPPVRGPSGSKGMEKVEMSNGKGKASAPDSASKRKGSQSNHSETIHPATLVEVPHSPTATPSTAPAVTPAATTPAVTPAATTSAVTPAATTPAVTPAATTPAVTPAATTPAKAASASPKAGTNASSN